MQNQNDYDRINKNIVAPLCVLFGQSKMADEMIDGFVEELRPYPEETLKIAFKHLRRTCKRLPPLASVIEACEQYKPVSAATSPESKKPTYQRCGTPAEIAKEILLSPAGQMALSLGVGDNLLVCFEDTGRKEFDENYVRKCQVFAKEAVIELAKTPHGTEVGKALHALWEAMQQREKRLYDKYFLKLGNGVAA